MNPQLFPVIVATQFKSKKCLPKMEARCLTEQAPCGLKTALVLWLHHSQLWGKYLGLDLREDLDPAFPRSLGGRFVVSFPFHLGFFFHFTEDKLFPPRPVPVLTNCGSSLKSM